MTIRPATLDDAGAVADLINTCSTERTGKPQTTARRLRSALQMPGLDLETDTLLVLGPVEQLFGFGRVQHNESHTQTSALAEVAPPYRGLGVGAMLCRWIEERARRSLPQAPANARVVVLQQRLSTDERARELLEAQGYRAVRHSFRMAIRMGDPPPQSPGPEGILIRPFVRDREAQALIRAMQQAFRDNWGYVERPFELEYERWMHILDSDPDVDPSPFWFVALDGDEIAGLCLCDPRLAQDPDMAWVYVVGVRPPWRRRGIALALLQHSFRALYRQGTRRVGLEVDARNITGATRLYEKAGMIVERRSDSFEKELRPAATGSDP
jgi:mycothiol synthase